MNQKMQRPTPAKPSRLGFSLVLPMVLFIGALSTGAWWLSEALVLRQTISEGRTVADMVENIGRWASQYGGVHVRTQGSSAKIPGNFLTRSVYAVSNADGPSATTVTSYPSRRNARDRGSAIAGSSSASRTTLTLPTLRRADMKPS